MRSHLPRLTACFGILAAFTPASAAAQSDEAPFGEDQPPAEHVPPATSTWAADPFAGMLLGFEAPAGVGLGLVFAQVDESGPSAAASTTYSTTIDGSERTASLVAYPVGRGVLVTGMFRYVQLNSAMDIAMGRAAPWTSVAARGGGIGLIGAF